MCIHKGGSKSIILGSINKSNITKEKLGYTKCQPLNRYQDKAVMDMLSHYHWREVSVLASADDFGMYGAMGLQNIAQHSGEVTRVLL